MDDRFSYSETYAKNINSPLKKLFPIFGIQPLLRKTLPFFFSEPTHPKHSEEDVEIITKYIRDHNFGPNDSLLDILRVFLFEDPQPVQAAIIRYMAEWESELGHQEIHEMVLEVADAVKSRKPIPTLSRGRGFFP